MFILIPYLFSREFNLYYSISIIFIYLASEILREFQSAKNEINKIKSKDEDSFLLHHTLEYPKSLKNPYNVNPLNRKEYRGSFIFTLRNPTKKNIEVSAYIRSPSQALVFITDNEIVVEKQFWPRYERTTRFSLDNFLTQLIGPESEGKILFSCVYRESQAGEELFYRDFLTIQYAVILGHDLKDIGGQLIRLDIPFEPRK